MNSSRPVKLAAALVTCAALAVAAAGCGGGGKTAQPKANPLAQPVQTPPAVKTPQGDQIAATPGAPATPAGQKAAGGAAPSAGGSAPASNATGGTSAADVSGATTPAIPAPRSFPTTTLAKIEQRALARLRSFQRDQAKQRELTAAEHVRAQIGAVRDLTDAVVVAAGLPYATFDVLDGGSTVTVNVDRKSACQLSSSDASDIESQIVNASDIVVRVKLRVDGTTLSLGRFLKKNCHQKSSAGVGKVLYKTDGSGTFDTPIVRVTGRTWHIVWQSSSALLQIYVYRNGKLRTIAVNHQGRGGGTRALYGPGRFKLHVAGTGQWSVQVLDSASD